MYERKTALSLDCGVHVFQEVVRGKWKIELIYRIDSGITRPGELQRAIPAADRRVLDQQLSELVEHAILVKKSVEEGPLKTEYFLTDLGQSLMPVIRAIENWGNAHREIVQPVIGANQLR